MCLGSLLLLLHRNVEEEKANTGWSSLCLVGCVDGCSGLSIKMNLAISGL